MIDLIALVVTLIIMSLFCIGMILALIIMSQPTSELEQLYEDEEQIKYIKEYNLKKQEKKEARKKFFKKIKNYITRR